MKKFEFEFDRIIVIESLPEHEKQIRDGILMSAGQYYTEVLFPYCNKIKEYPIAAELIRVNSKDEFLKSLDEVLKNIKETNLIPIIHFEIHGTEKKDGMTLNNGDFVDWKTILFKLTEINIATYNNLFVIFATCSGAFNLQVIMPCETVFPYHTALAPDNPEFPIFMEQKYSLFYVDLIIDGNIEKAFNEVHEDNGYAKIIISTCEYYLYKAFCSTIAKSKDKANIERFIKILGRESTHKHLNNKELRHIVEKKFNDPNLGTITLNKLKNKFLMANHPRNLNRFQFTVEDLLKSFS